MAICLFPQSAEGFGRRGDFVHTVRIADLLQKVLESSKLKEFKNETAMILVENDKTKKKVSLLIKDINPKIVVKKISEFKQENHKLRGCIQTGYSNYDWQEAFSFKGTTPLIEMPSYSNGSGFSSKNPTLKILGGFGCNTVGVIPTPAILAATTEKNINIDVLKDAFERLDPKMQSYLGKNFESYLMQREQRDFAYQFSHDDTIYPTFYTHGMPYKSYWIEGTTTQGEKYKPVEFFLQEHLMLRGKTTKSQDVFCIGDDLESKFQALADLKDDLIKKGYAKISFVNIDTGQEQLIHEINTPGVGHLEYRMLYSKLISFSSMQLLPLLATDIVGVKGPHSLVEAMCAKKLITFECSNYHTKFVEGYLNALEKEVSGMVLEGTSNEEVLLLARFLMKPSYRCHNVEYKPEEISRLLSNKNTVEVLKNLNRQLVEKSEYSTAVENMLMSEILPYIRRQNIWELKLVELLKALSREVRNNKRDSKSWENRFQAVNQLTQLIKDDLIGCENTPPLIQAQLEIINQNKPSWHERSLIAKILDILSLGLVPLCRYLFFKPDGTMACVENIEEFNKTIR